VTGEDLWLCGVLRFFWRNNCVKWLMKANITKNHKLWGKRTYPRDFSGFSHFEAIEIGSINPLKGSFWD
jgi:hypothetical protein